MLTSKRKQMIIEKIKRRFHNDKIVSVNLKSIYTIRYYATVTVEIKVLEDNMPTTYEVYCIAVKNKVKINVVSWQSNTIYNGYNSVLIDDRKYRDISTLKQVKKICW